MNKVSDAFAILVAWLLLGAIGLVSAACIKWSFCYVSGVCS
jgi:hypothetical protein